MRSSWISLIASAGFVAAIASHSHADRKKPGPATKADVERLEKKLEEQQRQLDKLVKLQQQYAQSLAAFLDAPISAAAAALPEPAKPPEPKSEPKAAPPEPKAIEAKPAALKISDRPKVKVKEGGMGTIVGKVAGASDAVVYIETISAAPRAGTATMRQEGKEFLPAVLVVQKGTTVQFPNRDAVFHNVFSVSPDNTFDLGSYRQGESKGVTMSRPGVVNVYCNMHPQMVGHILVVPNANYVQAGKDGFFRLTNVPAGRHRVVAWAPNAKAVVSDAEVSDGQTVTVELEVKKGRAAPHAKKDGLPYTNYEQ